jgi:hypothetical protein
MRGERLRKRLIDESNPNSYLSRSRSKRWSELLQNFPDLATMKVLDLGGTPRFWRSAPIRPAHVTTVNLLEASADEYWISHVVGDVLDQPTSQTFDLVVSNSLIEHVGGHANREKLAGIVQAVAPHHWIQTPYRYFPVEPHWLAPGMQFLPLTAQARVLLRWQVAWMRPQDYESALRDVASIELLSKSHMRLYFPDSKLLVERALGLPKSLVAIR